MPAPPLVLPADERGAVPSAIDMGAPAALPPEQPVLSAEALSNPEPQQPVITMRSSTGIVRQPSGEIAADAGGQGAAHGSGRRRDSMGFTRSSSTTLNAALAMSLHEASQAIANGDFDVAEEHLNRALSQALGDPVEDQVADLRTDRRAAEVKALISAGDNTPPSAVGAQLRNAGRGQRACPKTVGLNSVYSSRSMAAS